MSDCSKCSRPLYRCTCDAMECPGEAEDKCRYAHTTLPCNKCGWMPPGGSDEYEDDLRSARIERKLRELLPW